MKGTITYVKTEKVEITVAEEDIRKALQLYLANRLDIPATASWSWEVPGCYDYSTPNSVTISWNETPETIVEEVP